jgi:hypothetical protein
LFEHKYIVLADNVWSLELAQEYDIEKIKSSENIFFVLENDLSSENEKLLKNRADKFIEIKDGAQKWKFNIFSLADALGERNSKKLWILYQEALHYDIEAEEIHGILYWQIKNLILARKNLLKGVLKISPFVASKARGYSVKWQENELINLAEKIVGEFHRARLGQVDMEIALEKIILEI